MWLFLPFGFFSVVAVHRRKDHVFVRARDRDDISVMAERLREVSRERWAELCTAPCRGSAAAPASHVADCPACVPRYIAETPDADYPFRIEIHRSLWAAMLSDFAMTDLRYPNFKAEVYRHQGVERSHVYSQVWNLLRNALQLRKRA